MRLSLGLTAILLIFAPLKLAAQPIGYSWPYEGQELEAALGDRPVVLEIYSSQACVFCPTADRLFNDIIRKTKVIGLACHVDYFDVSVGALSNAVCSQRQFDYADHLGEAGAFTPQVIINGALQGVGYKFNEVRGLLLEGAASPPARLEIRAEPGGTLSVSLPDGQTAEISAVSALYYDRPHRLKIAEGANAGADMTYLRIVSAIEELGETGLPAQFTPRFDKGHAGVVVLAHDAQMRVMAAGEYVRPKAPKP